MQPPAEPFSYEPRYCAFIDILGFRNLIDQLRGGTMTPLALRSLLTRIHQPPTGTFFEFSDTGFAAQSISDAVAVSTKANAEALIQLFLSLESLALNLLHEGYFVRGAVVKGPLYHDEKMVFGEALVKAYSLEAEVVRFPRIMITSDIVRDINQYGKADSNMITQLGKRVCQADDGPYYLHILRQLEVAIGQSPRFLEDKLIDLAFYGNAASKIQKRFDDAIDNPRHFEKVQWFAKYWNALLRGNSIPFIRGPGAFPRAFQ